MLTAKAGTGEKAAMVYADVENTDMRFDVIEVFHEEKTRIISC